MEDSPETVGQLAPPVLAPALEGLMELTLAAALVQLAETQLDVALG